MQRRQPKQHKIEGQSFWDANPCGGRWLKYADYLTWIQGVEPYAYEIMDREDWTDKRVLDAGCGQGPILNYLPQFDATMFGVDMSLASLRRAAVGSNELNYSNYVHLSAADAERLPFPDAYFDTVLSFGVLHHTPDTREGVKELWRVLKPGGLALVMLYRTGNPKWWITRLIRGISRLADVVSGEQYTIANRLRPEHGEDDVAGTALLELFGCPILKAFSNRQALEMFHTFSEVTVFNHQPGFRRLADVISVLRPFESLLARFDRQITRVWGFYQVVRAQK
jgi:SAM-dependent methyltransferase